MIRFQCPTCQSVLETQTHKAGDKIECSKCGQRLQIPTPTHQVAHSRTVLGALLPPLQQEKPGSPQAAPKALGIICPGCHSQLRSTDSMIGQMVKCPICEKAFTATVPPPGNIGASVKTAPLRTKQTPAKAEPPVQAESPQAERMAGVGTAVLLLGVAVVVGCAIGACWVMWNKTQENLKLAKQVEEDEGRRDNQGRPNEQPAEEKPRPPKKARKANEPVDEPQPPEEPDNPPKTEEKKTKKKPKVPQLVVQLTGVHKPAKGNFGLLSAKDRNDLDLWAENPEEADKKWKGKLIEAEMAMNDLSITSDDDTSALITPTSKPWGIKGGWQPIKFLVENGKKKQLTGLQKLEGNIHIRGTCKGIVKGHLTFENCEIVKKPAVAAGDKEPAEKDDDKLAFDAKDLAQTFKWADKVGLLLVKNSSNALRFRADLEKFDKLVPILSGKTVRWRVRVERISETFVTLDPYDLSKSRDYSTLTISLETPDRFTFGLAIGKGISATKAAKLNPKDLIIITGKVVSVGIARRKKISTEFGPYSRLRLEVVLKDIRAE